MASEAVRKILAAESESDKKLADARKLRDEMLDKASGNASLTIQKRLGEAAKESDRIRQEYSKKLETYRENAEGTCCPFYSHLPLSYVLSVFG